MDTSGAASRRAILGKRLTSLVAVLAVAAGLLLAGTGPAAAGAAVWTAIGPGASVDSDGTAAPPKFHYDVADHNQKAGAWLFVTTAPRTGPVTLPWTWTGDHGRKQVRSTLTTGVYRDGAFQQIAVLVDDGPRDRSNPAFSYSGTTTLTINAGDRYGFLLTGSHSEKPSTLKGTFTLGGRPVLTVPAQPVTATASAEEGATAVTYAASARDSAGNDVPVTCTPPSGSQFPMGAPRSPVCRGRQRDDRHGPLHRPRVRRPAEPGVDYRDADGPERLAQRCDPGGRPGAWYRFPVQPDSTVQVDLTGLAANADLTLFGDIGAAFVEALTVTDLDRMGAEFAGDAYAPSVFSPWVFSPSAFSPSAFSPSAFSPSAFSPSAFSPSAFSPSVFSPVGLLALGVQPVGVLARRRSAPAFSRRRSARRCSRPRRSRPSVFSRRARFSSAQTRSLIAFSARDGHRRRDIRPSTPGTTPATSTSGSPGRNGACATDAVPARRSATTGGSRAPRRSSTLRRPATLTGDAGHAATVDPRPTASRLRRTPRWPQLAGVRRRARRSTARRRPRAEPAGRRRCRPRPTPTRPARTPRTSSPRPSATSSTATATTNRTLKYVVIIGDDSVVPFFRYPDNAPARARVRTTPRRSPTTPPREASLARNYVLGQDAYGARLDLALKGASSRCPTSRRPAGRVAGRHHGGARRATSPRGGAVATPTSTLATGYDFLTDAADAVGRALAAGHRRRPARHADHRRGRAADHDDRATRPTAGTRGPPTDLRTALLGSRHDLVFLAGHFRANNALAADYDTTVLDHRAGRRPTADLTDSLVFSAGCHSGYTIVDDDGVPGRDRAARTGPRPSPGRARR